MDYGNNHCKDMVKSIPYEPVGPGGPHDHGPTDFECLALFVFGTIGFLLVLFIVMVIVQEIS